MEMALAASWCLWSKASTTCSLVPSEMTGKNSVLFLSPASLLHYAGPVPFPSHHAAVRILQNAEEKLARG